MSHFLFLFQHTDSVFESKTESQPDTSSSFLDNTVMYNVPSFTCNILDSTVAFTLHVRNVDQSSVYIDQSTRADNQPTVQIKFTSIGSGCYPIPYAFAVQLPSDSTSILSADAEAWDNNVILQIELSKLPQSCRYLAGQLGNFTEYEFSADELSSIVRGDQDADAAIVPDALNVAVHLVNDTEIKIDITKKMPDDDTTKEKTKKKKRKNKKIRSFSESNCDDLRDANVELNHSNGKVLPSDRNNVQMTNNKDLNSTSASIDIDSVKENQAAMMAAGKNQIKTRSLSESSNDDQSLLPKHREIKGILKRRSSYHRSISESSNDDHMIPYSIDFGVGSIPEENCSATEMSESYKKHVRFDNNIQKQLFR